MLLNSVYYRLIVFILNQFILILKIRNVFQINETLKNVVFFFKKNDKFEFQKFHESQNAYL